VRNLFKLFFISFLIPLAITAQIGFGEDIVKIDAYSSFDKVYAGGQFKIAVKASIDEGWHINSNVPNEDFLIPSKLEIWGNDNFVLADVIYPNANEVNFEFSDLPVSVYDGEILIGGIVNIPQNITLSETELKIKFTYQACNDASCMPPATVEKTLMISVVDKSSPVNETHSEIFSQINFEDEITSENDDDSIAGTLESSGLLLSLIFVFLGGLALNLTPCVYPLIPITVGYFGGQSEGRTGKLFVLGLVYVLGMSITYSIVGVVTSLSGAVFGSLLQSPIVILGIAAILIALSLSMFGMYEFKLPDKWVMKAGGAKSGAFGALLMGLTMGIVAAPCIGPFVLGLVTYVAAKGDPLYGFLMFFFLAIGLGTPYLFLALFSGKIKNLPRAGFWMDAVKHIFGFILIGMAIYFIEPLLPKSFVVYVLPVYMIFAALYLMIFDKLANNIKGFRIFKIAFSVVIIGFAAYMLWPTDKQSPNWQYYSNEAFEQAVQDNQKIIIDFYADWCIPCKELDALTFTNPELIELSKEFVCFKVDMTKTMSEETEQVRGEFNIIGMPTIIFFNSNGNEVERLSGFIEAQEFIELMKKVR